MLLLLLLVLYPVTGSVGGKQSLWLFKITLNPLKLFNEVSQQCFLMGSYLCLQLQYSALEIIQTLMHHLVMLH